jgi:sugar lactone lactonase YvrE
MPKRARFVLVLTLLAAFACDGNPTGTGASPKPGKTTKVTSKSPSPTPKDDTDATPTPKGASPTPKPSGSPAQSGSPKPSTSPSQSGSPKPSTSPSTKPSATPSGGSATPTPKPTGTAPATTNLKVSTLAGSDIPTLTDGPANNSEFDGPSGVAVDAAGNVYVADTGNSCIRKITFGSDGKGTVSTLAGDKVSTTNGNKDDDDPLKARFNYPRALAVAADGTVYVADTGNSTIRKIATDGKVTTIAGSTPGLKNDNGTAAQFNSPQGLVLSGNALYVADTTNHQIRKIDLGDAAFPVTTVAGGAVGIKNDPDGTKAQFSSPSGMAIDGDKLYVLEMLNHRVRMIDLASETKAVTTFAGPAETVTPNAEGDADGSGDPKAARFNFKTGGGLAIAPGGALYIVDGGNARIRMIGADGVLANVAGTGEIKNTTSRAGAFKDGDALDAKFDRPIGIAIAPNGAIYVADNGNHRIRQIK